MKTTTMKKFMASIAALTMSAAIAAPAAMNAFAAPDLTISDSSTGNVGVAGKKFDIYQIAKATEIGDSGTYNYTINDVYVEYFEGLLTNAGVTGVDHTSSNFMEELNKLFENYTLQQKRKMADALAKIALEKGSVHKSVTISDPVGETNKVDLEQNGYYLIVDKSTSGVKSAYMLDTFETDTINIKADKPSIDKKIWEDKKQGEDEKDGEIQANELTEANNAGIGDVVQYVIDATVPDMKEYDAYKYIITDKLSTGLTYNGDVAIKIGNTEITPDTDIHVSVDGLTIAWTDLKACLEEHNITWSSDLKVRVTYSATVNESAEIGNAGNLNEVKLTYSTDPEWDGTGTEPTEDTPDEYTKTYVGEIKLLKVDGSDTPLKDVSFKLTSKDGTIAYYVQIEKGVVKVSSKDNLSNGTAAEDNSVTAEVSDNGTLVFRGLPAGDYEISEVSCPDGYNKVEDFTVTLSYTIDPELENEMTKAGTCTWTVSVNGQVVDVSKDDDGQIKVINRQGGLFPSTGGIGTTIFYTVGIAMLAGAGALVVFKRKSAEK